MFNWIFAIKSHEKEICLGGWLLHSYQRMHKWDVLRPRKWNDNGRLGNLKGLHEDFWERKKSMKFISLILLPAIYGIKRQNMLVMKVLKKKVSQSLVVLVLFLRPDQIVIVKHDFVQNQNVYRESW